MEHSGEFIKSTDSLKKEDLTDLNMVEDKNPPTDITTDKTTDKSTDKSTDKTTDKSTDRRDKIEFLCCGCVRKNREKNVQSGRPRYDND